MHRVEPNRPLSTSGLVVSTQLVSNLFQRLAGGSACFAQRAAGFDGRALERASGLICRLVELATRALHRSGRASVVTARGSEQDGDNPDLVHRPGSVLPPRDTSSL